MNQPVEPFLHHLGFSRNLGATVLAGFEEFFSFQLDHAQAFTSRSSRQMRTVMSGASGTIEPDRFPEVLQQWIGGTNALIQDTVASTIGYQFEMLRLLQKQAAEAREAIAESMHKQVAAIDQTSGRGRRGSKTSGSEKKLAA